MINVAIIDDNRNDAEELENFLFLHEKEYNLHMNIHLYISGKDFLKTYTPGMYSLIFLDIIVDNMNGIETAKQIRAIDSDVLLAFVTAEASYAIEGYEVDACAFLLKSPKINPQKLYQLLEKVSQKLKRNVFLDLSDSSQTLHLSAHALCYADVTDHKLTIHTREKAYVLRMSIEKFKSLLPSDDSFFECYRGIIINLDWISSLDKQTVTLKTGTVLPVSRRKYRALSNAYSEKCLKNLKQQLKK